MLVGGENSRYKNWRKTIKDRLRKTEFVVSETNFRRLIVLILAVFWAVFMWQSIVAMGTIPFNEFDEAHRAENAKRMKEYDSWLVPLTGSPFDRVFEFRIPTKTGRFTFLYYHLERPPLVYSAMVIATNIFGTEEWVYRLPSFVFGMLTIGSFVPFALRMFKTPQFVAVATGFLCLLTSSDLWLSSQYAQLDTALAFGLFISLVSIMHYIQVKKSWYLHLAAIAFGIGVLSKGQPAIIFAIPLAYLCLTRRLSWSDLGRFVLTTIIVVAPWLIYLCGKFGLPNVIKVFVGFAFSSAIVTEVHHLAPFFWYARWWWVSFRPGWTIFTVLCLIDMFSGTIDWKKKTLLLYLFGSLIIFSLPSNKLWWYVLPLIPAMSFYIFLSLNDWLKKNGALTSLSLSIFVLSRAPVSSVSNTLSLFYSFVYMMAVLYIMTGLRSSLAALPKSHVAYQVSPKAVYTIALFFCLLVAYFNFPKISPYDWGIKPAATFYASLPDPKCMWILDMPPESALYYGNAGEVHPLIKDVPVFGHCHNYLLTPVNICAGTKVYTFGDMKLYDLDEGYKIQCEDQWVQKKAQ